MIPQTCPDPGGKGCVPRVIPWLAQGQRPRTDLGIMLTAPDPGRQGASGYVTAMAGYGENPKARDDRPRVRTH